MGTEIVRALRTHVKQTKKQKKFQIFCYIEMSHVHFFLKSL